jgi:succinate dehydrogenase hydrophobic anchor subunit
VTSARREPAEDPTDANRPSSWLSTALTGMALLVLVTVHMVAHHLVVEEVGGLRTYDQVLAYVGHPLILVTEATFLVVVTWHAMLGLRAVMLDLALPARLERLVRPGVTVLGIVTVAYGLVLLGILASRA